MLVDRFRTLRPFLAWTTAFLFFMAAKGAPCAPNVVAISLSGEDKELQAAVVGEVSAAGFQSEITPNDGVALWALHIPPAMDRAIIRRRADPSSPWIDREVIGLARDSNSRRRGIIQAIEILRASIIAPKEVTIVSEKAAGIQASSPVAER